MKKRERKLFTLKPNHLWSTSPTINATSNYVLTDIDAYNWIILTNISFEAQLQFTVRMFIYTLKTSELT